MGELIHPSSLSGFRKKIIVTAFLVCSLCILLNLQASAKPSSMEDVVGCAEAKKQLRPIVDIFRDGSHNPRLNEKSLALVFYGPEGTGKRTMAKSVAAEAAAAFVEIDASDIQSSLSAVNSVRLRSLFGPVVLFVRNADSHLKEDEQDEMEIRKSAFAPPSTFLGRRRSGRKSGSKYEMSNLSQLLLNDVLKPSIASWIPSSPVMIILSSASKLSAASGNFFQQIGFYPPTQNERQQLFSLKLAAAGVSAEIAEKLAGPAASKAFGLNGAEISRLCFRAALKAGDDEVGQEELDTVLDEVEDLTVKDWQKEMTAVHEASHAVVAWMMEDGLTVDKITILPKGGALGSTQFKKRKVFTKENVLAMICTLLAGREAESVLLGYQDSGSRRDLVMATNLAYQSVAGFGFGGFTAAFDSIQSLSRPYSSAMGDKIDLNVVELMEQASKNASQLITTYQNEIIKVAKALLKKETLPTSKITALLGPKRVRTDLSSVSNFLKKQV